MIRLAHDHLAHVGPKKVGQLLRENCIWPGMFKQARQYCHSCDVCQKKNKAGEWKAPMGDTPKEKLGREYMLTYANHIFSWQELFTDW